jgi:hypothetical protein
MERGGENRPGPLHRQHIFRLAGEGELMKKIQSLLVIILSLTACGNRERGNSPVLVQSDTASILTEERRQDFFYNPIRDINNLSVKIDNDYLDSLNEVYTKSNQVQSTVKSDLCSGDRCTSFKIMTNRSEGTVFYFFKSDFGEYGYSNDQFFVVNDSLLMARSFIIGIEEWPSDSSETLWAIEEKLYLFDTTSAIIKERKKLTRKDFSDYNLFDVPFISTTVDRSELHKSKRQELKELLSKKNESAQ